MGPELIELPAVLAGVVAGAFTLAAAGTGAGLVLVALLTLWTLRG